MSPSRFLHPGTIACAIVAGALALRLWDLTARSLWLDEAVEYWAAAAPLGTLPAAVRELIQDPPLYSFLLHLWMKISSHEGWLRLLSVCFGLGSVLGAMVIGYRVQGWAPALAAGVLMSILPTAIRYSQEVGQYAPMQCFLVWSVVALLGIVRDPARGNFVRWVLVAVAAAYTYYGTVITLLVPFACFVIEAAFRRDALRVQRALWSLAAFFIAILPLLVYFLPHQFRRGPTADAFRAAAIPPVGEALRDAWQSLQMTFAFQLSGWPCTRVPGWLAVALFALLLLLAAFRQRRLVVWFVATWLIYAGMGWLHLFPLGFRHSNIMTALMVPVIACAVDRNGPAIRRAGAATAFALLCAVCIVSLPARTLRDRLQGERPCTWPETEDVAQVTKYWMEHRTPDQPTYVYYGAAPAFAYYADRLGAAQSARPPDGVRHCWRGGDAPGCRDGLIYYGAWTRSLSPEEKMASIFTTLGGTPDEFWFILAHAYEGENLTIGKYLLHHYESVDYLTATDASAVLLRRRAP
jgi:hypothetical protein